MNPLFTQSAEHIVHQLIYAVQDMDLAYIILHGLQFFQGDGSRRGLRQMGGRLFLL